MFVWSAAILTRTIAAFQINFAQAWTNPLPGDARDLAKFVAHRTLRIATTPAPARFLLGEVVAAAAHLGKEVSGRQL